MQEKIKTEIMIGRQEISRTAEEGRKEHYDYQIKLAREFVNIVCGSKNVTYHSEVTILLGV